jgi:uncharacterized protein DUF5906
VNAQPNIEDPESLAAEDELRVITDLRERDEDAAQTPQGPVTVSDFYSYMPLRQFMFTPTGELWPAAAVNARCPTPCGENGAPLMQRVTRKDRKGVEICEEVPLSPVDWLDRYRPIDQMSWAPGEPAVIRDRLVSNGGWIERTGTALYNLYRPPLLTLGDPAKAQRWLDHIERVFPDDVEHIVTWLAHRVQRPGEKINHALLLGGMQGVGKDTVIEPVKAAIGPWNFAEVSPIALLGRFNSFIRSVILRVSEARDLGDIDRFGFYEHLKTLTAAPPDVLRCDEKNLREHAVLNVTGVIITTNYKLNGIYLPADDRRHFVAWSDRTKEDFPAGYWTDIHRWYREEGNGHVAAYLAGYDLSRFDPKAPPPKTAAFHAIADANRAPEDAEMADALEGLGNPPAVTLADILGYVVDESFRDWLQDRRSSRQIPHRMETAGYVPVRNSTAKDGLWKLHGRRQVIYAKTALGIRDQVAAATALCRRGRA